MIRQQVMTLSLQYVPDWFVTQQKLKIWHDDDDYCSDDEIIKWYDGYIHQDGGIGVYQGMKKTRQENCGYRHESFLCLMTRYKIFLKGFFMYIKFNLNLTLRA